MVCLSKFHLKIAQNAQHALSFLWPASLVALLVLGPSPVNLTKCWFRPALAVPTSAARSPPPWLHLHPDQVAKHFFVLPSFDCSNFFSLSVLPSWHVCTSDSADIFTRGWLCRSFVSCLCCCVVVTTLILDRRERTPILL